MNLGELSDRFCLVCGKGVTEINGVWIHDRHDPTHKPEVHQLESSLSLFDFVAHLIYSLDSFGPKVLWLASHDEHKDLYRKRAAKAFSNWRRVEVEAEKGREALERELKALGM